VSSYRLLVTQGRRPGKSDTVADFEAADDAVALAQARERAAAYVQGKKADPDVDQWRFFNLQRHEGDTQSLVSTWMPTRRGPGQSTAP